MRCAKCRRIIIYHLSPMRLSPSLSLNIDHLQLYIQVPNDLVSIATEPPFTLYSHRTLTGNYFFTPLACGSGSIPSASNLLLASSSAHVCILFHEKQSATIIQKSAFAPALSFTHQLPCLTKPHPIPFHIFVPPSPYPPSLTSPNHPSQPSSPPPFQEKWNTHEVSGL